MFWLNLSKKKFVTHTIIRNLISLKAQFYQKINMIVNKF